MCPNDPVIGQALPGRIERDLFVGIYTQVYTKRCFFFFIKRDKREFKNRVYNAHAKFGLLLLFYALSTVFQLYHGSDMIDMR